MEKPKHTTEKQFDAQMWSVKRYIIVAVLAIAYIPCYLMLSPNENLSANFLIFAPIAIGVFSIYTIPADKRTGFRSITLAIATILLFLIIPITVYFLVYLFIVIVVDYPIVLFGGIIGSLLITWIFTQDKSKGKKRKNS